MTHCSCFPCNYFWKSQKTIFQQFVRYVCTMSSWISEYNGDIYMIRTPSINAKCRPMLIKIMAFIRNVSKRRSFPINSDQFWLTLIAIDRHWLEFIDIGINARILIGIGHWSRKSWHDLCWTTIHVSKGQRVIYTIQVCGCEKWHIWSI